MDIDINKKLTQDEIDLFSIIKNCIARNCPYVTARVAGGWVRDRVMGKPSDDIDIMLDKISGSKFVEILSQNLGAKSHVIKANPDASKHLETAGIVIPVPSGNKIDVDFAMARSEVYNENSRIPEIKEATAEEDSFRRDLTINSLFYNINSGKVEDFTGNGIKDLISHTIRTPQNPLKTLMDDPLRLFRIIRFASKYNWEIDDETFEAMKNPQIKNEINKKVSKERIEVEMSKMLKGPNPALAMRIMKECGIWEEIIGEAIKSSEFEGNLAGVDMDQNNPHHNLTLWEHTLQVIEHISELYKNSDPEKRLIMILSALLHDLGKLYNKIQITDEQKTSYKGHDVASKGIAELILRYLKFSNETIEKVSKMVESHMFPHDFVQKGKGEAGSKALRKFIRRMSEQSIDWLDVFNHAVADAYSKDRVVGKDVVEKYNGLKNRLENALATMNVSTDKGIMPILNGNEIMQILNVKPGPIVGKVSEFLKEIQDETPNITKEDAGKIIREKFIKNE